MNEFTIIGTSPPKVDAFEKVTGKATYTADYKMPGMLYLKMVRSPHAHARIIRLGTSKAERLFGVRGVVRPEDVPDKRTGGLLQDRYVLPRDGIVRYVGEPVLLVAADTADIAEEAVELVEIDYDLATSLFWVALATRTIARPQSWSYIPDRQEFIYHR